MSPRGAGLPPGSVKSSGWISKPDGLGSTYWTATYKFDEKKGSAKAEVRRDFMPEAGFLWGARFEDEAVGGRVKITDEDGDLHVGHSRSRAMEKAEDAAKRLLSGEKFE